MDDAFPQVLPNDPSLLQQMVREQQATVITLLKQRDAARQGQAQLEEHHGELEHEYGELQRRYAESQRAQAELEKRKAELEKASEELKKERDQKIAELELERLRLAHQLQLLKNRYYGPRADRVDLGQFLLEFAQELESRPVNPQDLPTGAEAVDPQTVRRVKHGRRRLADLDLPTVERVHDLPEAEKSGMTKIGQETTYQIERAPGFFYRVRHVQIKYARVDLEQAGENPQITLAAKPLQPIEKGMAGPGLLAYVVTSKFADYLPLYRLENIFARAGFQIDRSTMCVWAGDVADLIKPVYRRMVQRVLQSHVVGTDDTVMPMLDVGKCRQARMWVYRGDDEHPYNVFDFSVQGEAVFEMRADLSQPGDRTRLQTSPNCGGQEPSWETSGVKGVTRSRQVWFGKTNASEPLRKCRENKDDVETGELKLPWDQRRRCLFAADATSGIEAASARIQAQTRNLGTCRPDAKGEAQAAHRKGQSTDAGHRGGTARSSDERRVMRRERRGRVVHLSANRSTAPAGGAHG
jgi:transposase